MMEITEVNCQYGINIQTANPFQMFIQQIIIKLTIEIQDVHVIKTVHTPSLDVPRISAQRLY